MRARRRPARPWIRPDPPVILFTQSDNNVYTLDQEVSRCIWRIGQKQSVNVFFRGLAGNTRMECLDLMAKKIAVSKSTCVDMPGRS